MKLAFLRRLLQSISIALIVNTTVGAMPSYGAATRPVVEYTVLEQRIVDLIQHRNIDDIARLLADDFVYLAPGVDEPLSRSDWIEHLQKQSVSNAEVYGVSVIERGDFDMVSSLVRIERHVQGHLVVETTYNVDVWRRADHRLLNRYSSVPRRPPPIRPTGRN